MKRLDARHLRLVVRALLREDLRAEDFELGIYFVGDELMTQLNETHLKHAGTTDVITFDYHDPRTPGKLEGELFICVPEAVRQSAKFRCAWQQEVVRYIVHGVLHLRGYDDAGAVARRRMKREENRLLRRAGRRFGWRRVSGAAGR
jgi:rRNA maturation RNase YbeY